jgi:hypothetical protein
VDGDGKQNRFETALTKHAKSRKTGRHCLPNDTAKWWQSNSSQNESHTITLSCQTAAITTDEMNQLFSIGSSQKTNLDQKRQTRAT